MERPELARAGGRQLQGEVVKVEPAAKQKEKVHFAYPFYIWYPWYIIPSGGAEVLDESGGGGKTKEGSTAVKVGTSTGW